VTGLYVLTSPRKTGDDPWRYPRAVIQAAADERIQNPRFFVVDGDDDQAAQLRAIAGPLWNVVRYSRPPGQWLGGNKWPYWRLIETALTASNVGDGAVLLEDDLEFAPNALRRMLLFEVPPDVDAVSFFSGFLFRQAQMPIGLWRTPAPIAGCQAIKYPFQTLALLVRWAKEDFEWQKFNESDVALGLTQERLRLRFAHHMPDPVQHVGSVSLVSHGMATEAGIVAPDQLAALDHTLASRQSMNYVGPHFDCLRLFGRDDVYR